MDTRLTPGRYLALLQQDGVRLATLARAELDRAVPTCPGWTVADLVRHVAEVYQHKIACIRLQRAPDDWPPAPPPGDPVDWLDASLRELVDLLAERGPDAPSYTWWPPEQTVGFWYRRMAQETAVHRVDAESAAGVVTPVPPDLAVDGIDEVLQLMLAGDWTDVPAEEWGDVAPDAGAGQTVAVRADGGAWRATLGAERIDVAAGSGPADASIGGDPSEVLLWLWGRHPLEAVTVEGDPAAVAALRDRLALATQ